MRCGSYRPNVHWCQCCNPQKGGGWCVTMDQGFVWVNCELSSAIPLDAYLLIQQAEVNVFHISAVVGACGKDCLGGVRACKKVSNGNYKTRDVQLPINYLTINRDQQDQYHQDSDWENAWHLISQCNLSLDVVSFNSLVQCCVTFLWWKVRFAFLFKVASGAMNKWLTYSTFQVWNGFLRWKHANLQYVLKCDEIFEDA